jgi:hypothetical protein
LGVVVGAGSRARTTEVLLGLKSARVEPGFPGSVCLDSSKPGVCIIVPSSGLAKRRETRVEGTSLSCSMVAVELGDLSLVRMLWYQISCPEVRNFFLEMRESRMGLVL